MPQASEELRAKFPGSDREACDVLSLNFVNTKGNITPKVKGYVPNEREDDAIEYLFREWDYTYSPEALC